MADADRGGENYVSIGLRLRRMLVRSISFAVAIGVCLVLYELVAGQDPLTGLFIAGGIVHDQHARIGEFLLVVLTVFTLIVRISCNGLDAWSAEDEMDSFVRRHNSTVLFILVLVGFMVASYLIEKPGEVSPFHGLFLRSYWLVPLVLWFLAKEIVVGPTGSFTHPADVAIAREVSKDEFYRAMRARASKVGFAVVMLAGGYALLLLHYHAAQESAVMFAVLYAGVAGSLLYYDYLIWRADRVH